MIETMKKRAKFLFKQYKLGNPEAIMLIKNVIIDMDNITLMKCQHVIAKQEGFNSWDDMLKARK